MLPTQDEVESWFETLSNWGRWGDDDELGTLNLITAAKRREAAALVTDGVVVSCALDIVAQYPAGKQQRFMLKSGEGLYRPDRTPHGASESERVGVAGEYLGLCCHGIDVTHVDALSHMFFDRAMYNGKAASLVTAVDGATHHAVTAARDGIVTRGVLLDIPALSGRPWLDPREAVLPEHLEQAEARQGVRVEEGDAVLLRTGNGHRREGSPWTGFPGWHAACLPWLRERGVAAIAHDGPQDLYPSGYPDHTVPVHTVGIVAMGLWLIDNLDLEPLAAHCDERGRWTFQLVVAPVTFQGATGSPVTPLAIF